MSNQTISVPMHATLIIASGEEISRSWRVGGSGGATMALLVRRKDGLPVLEDCQTADRTVEWVSTTSGVAMTTGNRAQIQSTLKRVTDRIEADVVTKVTDAGAGHTAHLLNHAARAPGMTGDAILRLDPGTWHVEANADGSKVTLTRA